MEKLTPRRAALLAVVRRERGEWTTHRVMRLYRDLGWAPCRATARGDLKYLARRGLLTLRDDTPARRYFTLPKGGSQ